MINYKFNEDKLIEELKAYVDSTYNGHYSRAKYQATDFIFDSGHGVGFTIGNVLKYAQRYGKKGTPADARKDLQKILHYALMALYLHDEENSTTISLPEAPKDVIPLVEQSEEDIIAHAAKILGNKNVKPLELPKMEYPTSGVKPTLNAAQKRKLKDDLAEIEELAKLSDQDEYKYDTNDKGENK